MFNSVLKYYGGTNLSAALERVREYNAHGIAVSLSYIPITQQDSKGISKHIKEYIELLEAIHLNKLDCDVTLKLNQFGIYGGAALTEKSIQPIIQKARETNNFIWIDMEKTETVSDSIEVFKKFYTNYKNMGLCLQAYLKRTEADLDQLLISKAPIRLVKGFYKAKDFKTWSEVTNNYSKVMESVLSKSPRAAIATHDIDLIEKAKGIIKSKNITNAELQMFAGVRDELAISLVKEGYKVRLYLPYGNLFEYFKRDFATFDNYRNLQRFIGIRNIK